MDRFDYLFQAYISKTATPAERLEFQELLQSEKHDQQLKNLLDNYFAGFIPEPGIIDHSAADELLAKILPPPPRKPRLLWPRIAVAASLLIGLCFGAYFFITKKAPVKNTVVMKNDVNPGHQGATLLLASGEKVSLTQAANGQLAVQAGVRVIKAANGQLIYELNKVDTITGQFNTLSTGNGETYQVKLPDGTRVWLNSASSLTYNTSLNDHGRRKVRLTGEAYFEVFKDALHPFIVQTATQDVEVLGTHFDVNSYNDEPAVATTLLEGSVRVTSGTKEQVIKPGEQILNNGRDLEVTEPNIENILDWKNGDFNLEGLDFRVAMRKIARWYNLDIIYDSSVPDNLRTGGWLSRSKKLSTVLNGIANSSQVKFNVEGRKVYVSK